MSIQKDENYQKYKTLSKEELRLPAPSPDADGNLVIEIGELFCRISGCAETRSFRQPYLLRKHMAKSHPEVSLARAPIGKPAQRSLDSAKEFYRTVIDDYEARKKEEEQDQEKLDEVKGSSEPSKKRPRLE